MTRISAVLFALVSTTACAPQTPRPRSVEYSAQAVAEVRARHDERRRVYAALDTSSLRRLLADDFIAVGAGIVRDKRGAIEAMKEHDPRMPFDSITSDSVRIRVFGDLAVVSSINRLHMRDLRREPATQLVASNSATEVWHRRNGAWLLVHTQKTFFDQRSTPLTAR